MERVSGNTVEFDMTSLTPATHYTVKVYAVRDSAKSAATTTEFTTGKLQLITTQQTLRKHFQLLRGPLEAKSAVMAQSNHTDEAININGARTLKPKLYGATEQSQGLPQINSQSCKTQPKR